MADTSAANIQIGGPLPPEQSLRFINAVFDEGVGPEYGTPFQSTTEIAAHIKTAVDLNGPLNLYDCNAIGGAFTELETVLREIGLTYARGDDGHYSYPATASFWEPRMAAPREWLGCQDDHEPCLSISRLLELREQGGLDAEIAQMTRAAVFDFPLEIDLAALDAAAAEAPAPDLAPTQGSPASGTATDKIQQTGG